MTSAQLFLLGLALGFLVGMLCGGTMRPRSSPAPQTPQSRGDAGDTQADWPNRL